jgi:peroxiredoxin
MRGLEERYGSRGFAVVAINLDRDPKAAQEFLKKNAVPFRIVYDPKGKMAKAYKVEAMPSSFLFDRTGRQRAAHQGFKESERTALETQILDLLAESPPDSTKR